MTISEFQRQIEQLYLDRDKTRGLERTFLWFTEEVGELARELLHTQPNAPPSPNLSDEFADVTAWLFTLASLSGIDMGEAIKKYQDGCPRCKNTPCSCSTRERA